MKIITIGREFGSGGRELGKRLAEALGIPCYDKEIIHEAAKMHGLSEEYVENISAADIRVIYPATIGRSFAAGIYYNDSAVKALSSQQTVIQKLAMQGDCVFIGRGADAILKELNPLNIFVYADKETKLKRCLERGEPGETEKEILKQMQRIDKSRANTRNLLTDSAWGKKETYHLCINTSGLEIKAMIPGLLEYVKKWFEMQDSK